VSNWKEPEFSISEESKDAWKILKHHTEVASDRIYEELPDIIQHAFEEGIAYAREQIARDDEMYMIAWNCPRTHPAGMEGCDYCSGFFDAMEIAAAIARGENK